MNGELEYLVRVYTDAVRVGTVKGFAKRHRPGCKDLQEETLSVGDCGIGGSYGRKGTNLEKRQGKCW